MSAFTFYLENSPNGPLIKNLFLTGVAIIKSDLPIIFLIFLLILSPRCAWSALRASEDEQEMDNGSPSRDPKTRDTATAELLSPRLVIFIYSLLSIGKKQQQNIYLFTDSLLVGLIFFSTSFIILIC